MFAKKMPSWRNFAQSGHTDFDNRTLCTQQLASRYSAFPSLVTTVHATQQKLQLQIITKVVSVRRKPWRQFGRTDFIRQEKDSSSSRDRFYKTLFRPKTFQIKFSAPNFAQFFHPKTTYINLSEYYGQQILELKVF
jgi:hypothetical protein